VLAEVQCPLYKMSLRFRIRNRGARGCPPCYARASRTNPTIGHTFAHNPSVIVLRLRKSLLSTAKIPGPPLLDGTTTVFWGWDPRILRLLPRRSLPNIQTNVTIRTGETVISAPHGEPCTRAPACPLTRENTHAQLQQSPAVSDCVFPVPRATPSSW
jgi:hypothetical protein